MRGAAGADRSGTDWRPRLLAVALAITTTVGAGALSYAFGVLLVPMVEDLGWSNAVVSAGLSIGLVFSGLCAPTVGRVIDTHGARGVMLVGTFVGAAGLLLWSVTTSVVVYLAAWAVIGAGMAMLMNEPAFAAVARHAPHQRRQAVMTITLLGGLSATIFIPITEQFVQRFGWRGTLLVLAVLLLTICTPTLAFGVPPRGEVLAPQGDGATPPEVADRPQPPVGPTTPAGSDPADAPGAPTMRNSAALRRLTAAMILSRAATIAVTAHLVAFLVASGRTATLAAGIAGAVGVAKIGGRLVVGFAARWWSTRVLLLASLFASAAGLAVPLLSSSLVGDLVMVVGFGAGAGAVTMLRPLFVADLFGVTGFGVTSGRVGRLVRLSEAATPVVIGGIVTFTGSYTLAWALLVSAGLLAVPTLPRPRTGAPVTSS